LPRKVSSTHGISQHGQWRSHVVLAGWSVSMREAALALAAELAADGVVGEQV
jgi:hypothetical protein